MNDKRFYGGKRNINVWTSLEADRVSLWWSYGRKRHVRTQTWNKTGCREISTRGSEVLVRYISLRENQPENEDISCLFVRELSKEKERTTRFDDFHLGVLMIRSAYYIGARRILCADSTWWIIRRGLERVPPPPSLYLCPLLCNALITRALQCNSTRMIYGGNNTG